MSLRVPDAQIVHIKKLLELPDDKMEGFLDAVAKTGPKFNVYDLAEDITARLELPRSLTLGLVQVLASLYQTRPWQEPIAKFVDDDVFGALKRAQTFSTEREKADVQWSKLRPFLIAALSLERTIGTAAKAGDVLTHHERIFNGARIMTDMRPIFHRDASEKPDAAVIIHMLVISQRNRYGSREDLYFALDSNDIAVMKEIIERAAKKEEKIKEFMKSSGVAILDPKPVF